MKWSWLAACLLFSGAAQAHDWYDHDCCNNRDCAPVTKMSYDKEGRMIVTTKHGTATVPANFPRRESRDGQWHACMTLALQPQSLICLYEPPHM